MSTIKRVPVVASAITIPGLLFTFFGAVLFSTKAIMVKKAFAHTGTDAVTLLALRMLFAVPFFLVAAFTVSNKAGNIAMSRKQWLYTLALGLCGYYISSLFDFIGLQYISAGLERLILFLYPTFVLLLNALFFKQKIKSVQAVALLLTYTGIAIAYLAELRIDTRNPYFLLGCGLVFCCAVTYAIYIVGSGRIIAQVGASKFTAYAMLSATAGVMLHFLISHPLNVLYTEKNFWLYGILLAVFATVIPSFFIAEGLKRIGANNVAIISGIGPVSTIIQAHYFLGEPILATQVVGTALVIAGILLIGWKK